MKEWFTKFQFAFKKQYLLIFILIIIFVALIWEPVEILIKTSPVIIPVEPKEIIALRHEYRKILLQTIAGIVVLIGLYFTYWRIKVSEEGQITERFTRSIEHLGSEKLEVRIGGIYALERIARDSYKDHWTVMEVLTAYIRERTPAHKKAERVEKTSVDIQAALTVIGRRKWLDRERKESRRLNLSQTTLQEASFAGNFHGVFLAESDLRNAIFVGTNLRYASFAGAWLQDAYFENTDLEGADFQLANLQNARLWRVNFKNTYLRLSDFQKADFAQANMDGARLLAAKLEESTNLTLEQLSKVKTLYKTQLNLELKKQIKDQFPHLMEQPPDENIDWI